MKFTIFAKLRQRLRTLLSRVEFLGSAKRLAESQQELTLESLERFAHRELGVVTKRSALTPPRFVILRHIFLGERATRPWLTNEMMYAANRERYFWLAKVEPEGKPFSCRTAREMNTCIILAVCGMVFGFMGGYELSWDQSFYWNALVNLLGGIGLFCFAERMLDARRAMKSAPHVVSMLDQLPVSLSSVMLKRLENVLHAMKEDLVGSGSPHAANIASVCGSQARLLSLQVRLHRVIKLDCGVDPHQVEFVEESQIPEHLLIAWKHLKERLATAARTLKQLDDFQARVDALFTEAALHLNTPLRRYDHLELIRDIETEGVRLDETVKLVRRDINDALNRLQANMELIREQVTSGSGVIAGIVAALPTAASSDGLAEELERVVDGLMPSRHPAQRTLA